MNYHENLKHLIDTMIELIIIDTDDYQADREHIVRRGC